MTTRRENDQQAGASPVSAGSGSDASLGVSTRRLNANGRKQAAGTEGEVPGIFESCTLLVAFLGMLEVGFIYTTMFAVLLMTVAFAEMMRLQADKAKEEKIQIKTRYVEWYFYVALQFCIAPRTWLDYPLLQRSDLAPESGSLPYKLLYQYHSLASFVLLTFGLILFVVSLQEGFYPYQFKRLGWTLLSAFCIVVGCTGLVVALWRNRLWFFFAVTCISVHNGVDYVFCRYFPRRSPVLLLKPEATIEGFAAGSVACFAYFFIVRINFPILIDVYAAFVLVSNFHMIDVDREILPPMGLGQAKSNTDIIRGLR